MAEKHTRGEMHGCIVCGKLYELYVVYDPNGRFMGSKVMSAGGKSVPHALRALVACEHHQEDEIGQAVERVYGKPTPEEDE
jgi:succinate dehydrogenase/fumarate reductase-like Fe-S protein